MYIKKVFIPYYVPVYTYPPPLPSYKSIFIDKGLFDRMGRITGLVLCVHDVTITVIMIITIYTYTKDTTFNWWILSGFYVVILWCHNLNDKKIYMTDIA